MVTTITPLLIDQPYAALTVLTQAQLNEEASSIQDYVNSKVILNIVQLAIDTFSNSYVFTNDGIPAFTTPLIDQAALLAQNETITGNWTFTGDTDFTQPVSSSSYFSSTGQQRAKVYITTTNQAIADNLQTSLAFLGESYDVGGMHDPGVNPSRITIPTGGGGHYTFVGQVAFFANNTGYREVYLFKNGVEVARTQQLNPTAGNNSYVQIAYEDDANQNDFFEMFVYQNSGAPLDVLKNANVTFFSCIREW